MFRKKVYGESRNDSCFFCAKAATTENDGGLPACIDHKGNETPALKCACGKFVDIKKSKWGVFFLCMSCGPISRSKMTKIMDTTSESGFKLNKKFREAELPKPQVKPAQSYNKLPSTMSAFERYKAAAKDKLEKKSEQKTEERKTEQKAEIKAEKTEKIYTMDELVELWNEKE